VDLVFAVGRLVGLALRFAIVLGFTTELRPAAGLALASDLRLAGAGRAPASANRRRGLRLAPRAADLVLLADDARFME
jgi:hypothetical protein